MLEPCCVCREYITSFVKKSSFRVKKQIIKNENGELLKEIELQGERLVCPNCIKKMEGDGCTFHKKTKLIEQVKKTQ